MKVRKIEINKTEICLNKNYVNKHNGKLQKFKI